MNVIEAVGMTPTAPECRQRICSARKDFLPFRLDMEDRVYGSTRSGSRSN